jgi:chaperonin GroEL
MKPVRSNVLPNDIFQPRMMEVLDIVAESVAQTLGPYGHNALIQTTERVVSTKDGWNVMQNIHFDSIVDNSMKSLIESVAHSVVLRVGDGSTSSTYTANRLLKYLYSYMEEYKVNKGYDIPNRAIENALTQVFNDVEMELRKNSVAVTEENMAEMIKKVALVSSNWNEEMAQMISDIYVTTHNPIIKVQNSGTDRTSVEYVEGYDLSGRLLAPQYINNFADNKCEVEKPLIMVFNFRLSTKYTTPLIFIGAMAELQQRPFIVMAPDFDKTFMDQLLATNANNVRMKRGLTNLIPVQYDNKFNIDRECVDDFVLLINSQLVTSDDDDMKDFFDDVTKMMTEAAPEDPTEKELFNANKANFMRTAIDFLIQYCGTCEKATITDKGILVSGLPEDDFIKDLVAQRKEKIESEVVSKTKECDALTMLTDDIRMKRIRLGKLQCNMGIIKIGGFGDADLKAKKDALEDTTRACEAAYRDGVTWGSGIAILTAISNLINEERVVSEEYAAVLSGLYTSVIDVLDRLIRNKYPDGTIMSNNLNAEGIAIECVDKKVGFNLLTEEFDTDFNVVNPVNVDIEILHGCLKLVVTCISSNQFLYRKYEGMDIMDDEDYKPSMTLDEFVDHKIIGTRKPKATTESV